ncbi:gliding motility-associated C-terminal domain-containing protein [Flavobacterium tructae]
MRKILLIALFVLLSFSKVTAQTPGMIYNPATGAGTTVLDPNGDGFTSATANGFTTDDQLQSEIPYKSLVFPMIEPNSDLSAGPNCSFTDFVDQGDQDPVQSYLDGNGNWLFRMRMGSSSPNSKSYSILIDTDGKFGGVGPNADPQYSNSNPGFEIEIVLATNFGVFVYDVNNNNCTPVISYAGTTNYQKSIALTTSCSNPDYFYDFFVKMSDLTTTFAPLSTIINSSTAIRMAMVDNMGAQKSTLCNPASASDIAGIDSSCGSLENCFVHIIDNYTPCAPGVVCPDRSLCPGISGVSTGDSSVSGTSTEADGTVITVYKNGASIGTTSVSLGVWTLTGISPVLTTGQIITATSTAPGKGQSIANCNPVTVVSCALSTTVPAAGDITKISGSKGYSLTVNRPVGTIVRCYNANGTLINPVALILEAPYNLNTVTTTSNPQTVLFKCQTGNCFGTAVYLFTYQEPGKCESGYTYDCQYSSATATANPTIATSPVLSSTTSISGSVNSPDNVSGITVNLLANGTQIGTATTTAGGAWTISGLSLSNRECQTLSVTAIASGKCISTGSVMAIVQRKANTPIVNGPICSTAAVTSVSGSLAEAAGTIVQVYENGVLEGTTTVAANGTWTASTGISIALGSTITARALGTCLSLSNVSNSIVVGTKSSNALVITTSSVYECGNSVSGTGTNGDIISLFVDGFQVGGTTTVSGGTWTIGSLSSDCSLYMGGVITAKATTGSNCEGSASAGVTIVCMNPSNSLNVTLASTSICSGSTAAVTVQGSESGIIYQLFNGASMSGSSKSGTGTNLTLTSAALNSSTSLTVKAIKLGTSCSINLVNTASVTIASTPAPTGSSSQSFCSASTVGNLSATGSTINWYAASSGGSPLATSTPLTDGTHYFASQTVSGCESVTRLDVTAHVNITAAPTGSSSQSFCSASTVSNLSATGSTINWYSASSGGSPLATSTPLTDGTHYFASQTVSGCESATRLDVTAHVNITPAPTGNATQSFCSASTVSNLSATGSTINWYSASSGGSPLATSTPLTDGTHYFASQTVSGCESVSRLDVTAHINITPAPTGSGSQSFCSASTVGNLSATGSTINWYAASSGGSPLATSTPLTDGAHYFASQTVSGCESADRFEVTATINITPAPTGSSSQSFCSASTVGNLSATGSTINWYSASSGGSPLAANTPLIDGTHYFASQTVSGCESATRLDVTAHINITAAPTGSSSQSFCSASTVGNLSATGSTINWYAASSGGSPLAANTPLTDGAHYFASQTVSGCESATRLDVTAHINITPAPTGNAIQNFCAASTVGNLSATGTTINWYSASSGGSPLATSTPLTDGTHYFASQTVSGCESATRLDVTAHINITPAPTGSSSQSFCSASTVSNLSATGSTINWYAASSGGSPLATSTPLTDGAHYFASQTVSGCESADRFEVTATINITPAPTGSSSQSFCSASTVGNLSATGSTINWYSASSGGSPLAANTPLIDGTHYFASQTVSGCESATRLDVTAHINITPAPTGSSSQSFCSASTVGNLSATGTTINWYSASSGGSPLATSTPLTDGTHYFASQTVSGCESATRLDVTAHINITPAPTGNAIQNFCAASTVGNLSATGTTINWYSASSGGSPLATSTPLTDGTHYFASQTVSGCESATRLDVTAHINITAAPTGSSSQSFCSASTVSNLSATGSTINWYAASSGGSPLATSTPLTDGAHYFASQTVSGCESADRFEVTATINITPAPTGSSSQSFCSASTVSNLSATGSTINWYSASSGGSPLSTSTPLTDGTHYFASQTVSGCESADRFEVTATVNITPAPIGNATQNFCAASTVGDLSATGSTINWYLTSSGGSPLATSTPLTDGTHYFASQTVSGCESADRFEVTATVNITPAPIGNATQNFCAASTVGDLSATGSTINWYLTSSGGSPLSTSTPLTDGTHYFASQTVSGCESADRFEVTATVNITPAPIGNATQNFCAASTVGDLSATGSTINWYLTSSGGSPLATSTPLTDGTHYFASQTVSGCESADRFEVTATVNITPAPIGNATQNFCAASTVGDLSATGSTINWYSASSGGSPLATSTPLTDGTHYFASQTVSGCESATRLEVTATVNITPAPIGNATQNFCAASTVGDLSATGSTINWYLTSSGGSPLSTSTPLTDGTHYFASQTVSGCESADRFEVTATVNITPAPIGNATQNFCATSTVGDLSATGSTINWYSASSGGGPLATSTPLTDGTHYFASQTVSGCESATRLEVTATVNITPAPIGNATQNFCAASTVGDLSATGSTINWYLTSSGGSPLSTSTPLTDGTHYFASQTVSGCESADRFEVTATVNITPAPIGNATQNFCAASTVGDLSATGSTINWYLTSSGGSPLATSTPLTDGTHYFASQTVSGCDSADRFEVTATVNITPAPIGNATQNFCAASTVGDLSATGSTINWYSASSGGSPLVTSTPLTDGTHYFASQTVSGCESADRFEVIVMVDALTIAGSVNGGSTICLGSPSAELTLSGHTGTVVKWQSAVNPFLSWSDIANTTTSYTSGNLIQTTQFRAIVKNGNCTEISSSSTTVTVDLIPKPVLNNLIQPSCSDANGSFNISNYNGLYSYEVIPSSGVSIVGNKVTAPVGFYTVIAKSGLCSSLSSEAIVLNNYVCPIFENRTIVAKGGTVFANITSNDIVNGMPATLGATGNATVAVSGVWPAGITLDPATGKVTVAAGTVPGTYNVVYELCDKLTPQACATVSNEIKVLSIVEPISENGSIVVKGGTVFANITSNDIVNGMPATLGATGNATVAVSGVWPAGITLDPVTGKVTVAAGIAPGIYNVVYELCDRLIPQTCATVSDEIVVTCNSTVNIAGIVKNLKTNTVLANVPVTLIPQNKTTGPILLQITKSDGSYSFSGIIPGDYLVQVQDANINTVYQLYPVNGSLRFTTIQNCEFQKFDFEYDLSALPVLGDYVWYDLNGNGIQDEWYDANNDGIVTKNIPDANGSVDYSQWEWIDFNGDGSSKGPLNAGELNRAGFGNSKSPNILITGPNGYSKSTIIGIQGYWRDRPGASNPWGEYSIKLQMDSNLEAQSQAIGSTGLVKIIPGNTLKEISSKTNRTQSFMVCGVTAQSIKTVTLSTTESVHLDLDFGISCTSFANLVAVDDSADPVDGISGTKGFLNVLANDTFNGLPIDPQDVILTVVPNVNFVSNSNGTLDILPNTPGGTYTLTYTICEEANPSNCSAASVTVFVARPSIALVKTAHFNDENGNGYAEAGETVTYNFIVTNTGNVALTKVSVRDPLTGIIMTGGAIDLAVGQVDSASFTGVYSIMQSDINLGSISNQAEVSGISTNGVLVKDKSDYGSVVDDKPTVLPISGCVIKVFNAISMNSDKMNELFYIQGIECYPDNVVEIYNRWGVLVYQGNHYDNLNVVFRGFSDGRATVKDTDGLPEGTYYYILKYKNSESKTHQLAGYLFLTK